MVASRVLTVNQMLDILISYEDTQDWLAALKKVRAETSCLSARSLGNAVSYCRARGRSTITRECPRIPSPHL